MFEDLIRELKSINQIEYRMSIEPDEDGYYDKECPDEKCLSKFKVYGEDWVNLFSDDKVYCPFCGYSAPANRWYTTEQVDQAQSQGEDYVASIIDRAIENDIRSFNRRQNKNSFIKITLRYEGGRHFVNLPAPALEEMVQKIRCESCGARYAFIGAAFFCPCCGKNSAKHSFNSSIKKVCTKVENIDKVRNSMLENNKDDAEIICKSLIESTISDLVVAFQRLCESVYPTIPNSHAIRSNVFQRLQDGSELWKEAVGTGYEDWLDAAEWRDIRICFQKRHLFQHKDGIVDQGYIDRSGDDSYCIGQRLVVKVGEVIRYSEIVEKMGKKILGFSEGRIMNE